MYLYQQNHRYFAQTAEDIKELAEEEILSLGATDTRPVFRGIHFKAFPKNLYKINFQARLPNRILAPLKSFKCHSDRYLYKQAQEILWHDFLDASRTLAVSASVSHSRIKHSKFAALRLKDAVVDQIRDHEGKRPSVDTTNPDVQLNLYIENDRATISLDTSGGSLHRRGYRRKQVEAPMLETLAAAIIEASEWNAVTPLYDPFCGSGTLLCEAFMKATNLPAGILRGRFGFENLPDFEARLWKEVRQAGIAAAVTISEGLIGGSDVSLQAVDAARLNCATIDRESEIKIEQRDVFEIDGLENTTIITNPPYGLRLNQGEDLSDFYRRFGDFLKQRCRGSTAYIYFGDRSYIKQIGLRSSWKKPFSSGGLDGRLVKYELY